MQVEHTTRLNKPFEIVFQNARTPPSRHKKIRSSEVTGVRQTGHVGALALINGILHAEHSVRCPHGIHASSRGCSIQMMHKFSSSVDVLVAFAGTGADPTVTAALGDGSAIGEAADPAVAVALTNGVNVAAPAQVVVVLGCDSMSGGWASNSS